MVIFPGELIFTVFEAIKKTLLATDIDTISGALLVTQNVFQVVKSEERIEELFVELCQPLCSIASKYLLATLESLRKTQENGFDVNSKDYADLNLR